LPNQLTGVWNPAQCLSRSPAPSYSETNWPAILQLYDAMLAMQRSPVYLLNRAIVLAEISDSQAAINKLNEMQEIPALRNYHFFDATLGELHRRAGNLDQARKYLEAARQKTRSVHDRHIIDRRLAQCS
jgi:RNA polymerase sigma-70 factor, ECF subfamily